MQNDGLDGRVIAKLFELPHDRLRRKNHSLKIDHANAVAKAADAGIAGARMHGEIDKSKDGEHEEKKRSSADQDPEQGARTSVSHEESLAPAPPT